MKTKKQLIYLSFLTVLLSLSLSGSTLQDVTAQTEVNSLPQTTSAIPVEGLLDEYKVPIVAYTQNDPSWANYLYGGVDPMASHGCGPTVLAIGVSSLSDQNLTPVQAADWSTQNSYHYPDSGSVHALIPDGATNFGLKVEILSSVSEDIAKMIFLQDKIIVFLMGPGDFTDGGHFIIAYGYAPDGTIYIHDPASPERSSKTWPISTLVSQVSKNAYNGGPIWVLSQP